MAAARFGSSRVQGRKLQNHEKSLGGQVICSVSEERERERENVRRINSPDQLAGWIGMCGDIFCERECVMVISGHNYGSSKFISFFLIESLLILIHRNAKEHPHRPDIQNQLE